MKSWNLYVTKCPWAANGSQSLRLKPASQRETLLGRMMAAAPHRCILLHIVQHQNCAVGIHISHTTVLKVMIHNLNIFNCIFTMSRPLYVQIIKFLDFEQCLQYDCKSGREKWNWHSSSSSQTHDSHVDKQTGQCSFWLRLQILTKLTHFHNVFPSQADLDTEDLWPLTEVLNEILTKHMGIF